MSSKPVRVCLNCYEKLQQKPNANAGVGGTGANAGGGIENNKQPPLSSSGEDSEDDDKDASKAADDHDEARFYGDGDRGTNNGTHVGQ